MFTLSERESCKEDTRGGMGEAKEQCPFYSSLQCGNLGGKGAKRTSDKSGHSGQLVVGLGPPPGIPVQSLSFHFISDVFLIPSLSLARLHLDPDSVSTLEHHLSSCFPPASE